MSPAAVDKQQSPRRKPLPWRGIHRIGAFVAVLLMLWLGGTGSLIQTLDLNARLAHLPPEDPTALSIVEGMYGPANYAVIQVADFHAATLPAGFDIRQGIATTLQAAQAESARSQDAGRGTPKPLTWIELRMLNGSPVGQVMQGGQLQAFDARSGQPVAALAAAPIPQGRRLPYSLRQKLKTLHRFWNRDDTPGVYFEFLAGLVLWGFLVTGLVMYFQLLKARRRLKRRQLFWLKGGLWRGLHRSVSLLAALFLVCIAASGTWIGFESSYNALGRSKPAVLVTPGAVRLDEAEVPALTATTVKALARLHPGIPIKVLRIRNFGQMAQGVAITGGGSIEQVVVDARTGASASLTEPSYPRSGFPLGVQVHENVKHFHSGEMFGLPGQAMSLFAGLSLLFLSLSGVVMYADMWLSRRRSGRPALIWRP